MKILIFTLKNTKNRMCLTVNKNIYFKLSILYIRICIYLISMYVCMYVYMYVCMYVCMYVYMYVCIYVYVGIFFYFV